MDKYNELFIASTDTVVGIGAPISEENGKLIMKIKNRPPEKRLLIMVGSIAEARTFEGWNENAEKIAQKYWPGQVTIVLEEVGIRIPNSKGLIKLLEEKGPVYMTSANKSGFDVLDFQGAVDAFPEIKKHYNFGHGSNVSSTIIKADNLSVIRQGNVEVILD